MEGRGVVCGRTGTRVHSPVAEDPAVRTLACLVVLGVVSCGDTKPKWRVSGYTRLADGSPIAGVKVLITWPEYAPYLEQRTETTDQNGHYTWSWYEDMAPDTMSMQEHVLVEATLEGYTFSPAQYDVRPDNTRDDLDFVAQPNSGDAAATTWLILTWAQAGAVHTEVLLVDRHRVLLHQATGGGTTERPRW